MLDDTIDTMALMMASFTLDQVEQHLRDQGKDDLANALQKLQIDTGYHMGALSEGFDSPEGYIEQKISPRTGKEQAPMQDDVIAQIRNFEPLTYERLKMLTVIEGLLPEGDLRHELNALNAELAQSAPASAPVTQTLKPAL